MMKIASRLKYICPRCQSRLSNINIKFLPYSTVFSRLFSSISHYEILDVPKTATHEEIKKAFFEKSKKFHPDVSPGSPHHHKIFIKLNNAYSILGDKSKRKDYDRSLKPKTRVYAYQSYTYSNENLHQYRDSSFYYGRDSGYNFANGVTVRYTASERPKNYKVALAIILLMSTGVAVRLMWIGYKHKQYKKQLDINSMKASQLYQESRERSSKYTMKEQLEMLAERQGKIEPKR